MEKPEPLKLQPVPASIITQLTMLQSTVDDAERKCAAAKADIKSITETFHGLIGKRVVYREKQFRREMTFTLLITSISCDKQGQLRWIGGIIQTKQDIKNGFVRTYGIEKRAGYSDILDGRVTVIGDA